MRHLVILLFVLLFFNGCAMFYSKPKEKVISTLSDNIKKLEIGMTNVQVINSIGEPDMKIRMDKHVSSWEFILYSIQNRAHYPDTLVQEITDGYIAWGYEHRINIKDVIILSVYFNDSLEVLGFSVQDYYKPDDWDQLIAEKERKAQQQQ